MYEDDEAPEENSKPTEALLEKMADLENLARKQGLYMQGFQFGISPDQHGQQQTFAMVTMFVGEEAFSDRVLHPEKYAEDHKFRQITTDVDPLADIAEEMRKRIAEGKDPFGED